ncbi:ribosomal-protein-alanine acetyltransferase [Deferribacter desulfuricans SSM1]|uniref:[Ribosomal protein bS18]-alanine N-acetyltransferase n=1 Tax=Deferribacter desulfuricans (strain DSM 14783 / JCM 11476 / NBRC 101012 / SSM1) TaxID=639282 RepID=D3PEF4_DEFDS|nr:ribosomal protein S18-alanine N-acetyltransferase [Deferribacter desulfuricans]BAI80977.1 ribosomal-protein-alanine acetyltransferase [Deferribacter desulfuricans SSM1]
MIRLATHNDLEDIYNIEVEVYDDPWSLESFENELESSTSYVYVYEEEQIIGFVIYWDLGEEVEIANIAVKKSFQGKGVGRKLLDFVLNNTDALYYYLEVESNNEKAIKLYTSFGFLEYNFRKHYYGLNRHAKLMKLIKG